MPRTHFGEGHSACAGSEEWEFFELEAIFVRILHVSPHRPPDLVPAGHAAEVGESFLLAGRSLWVLFEAEGGLVEVVLLAVEVRSGAVEIVLRHVSASKGKYLSIAE